MKHCDTKKYTRLGSAFFKALGLWGISFTALRPCLACCLVCMLLFCTSFASLAATTAEIIAENQAMAVQSNEIDGWPEGPTVSAVSAILIEAETGTILYAKNIHEQLYPASITKILTTLIAYEASDLNEIVTFSHDAVYDTPRDSNNIAMNEGDTLTMEECLNAILIRSANEVAYAVAEHVGGTREAFVELMNQKAAELGCVDSHFANPNGLQDEDHYTSVYDMAQIGRAFFANEFLCEVTLKPMLVVNKNGEEYRDLNKMQLLSGQTYAYEYLVGCKTGYTTDAHSTLVSCAEKDGLKLICVVMMDEAPYQYEDTIALFNYGFSNFKKVNVSENETTYNINTASLYGGSDIFGSSTPLLSLNTEDFIVLPATAAFSDAISTISYEDLADGQAALLRYTYNGVDVGSASIDFNVSQETFDFTVTESEEETLPDTAETLQVEKTFLFVDVKKLALGAACFCGLLALGLAAWLLLRNVHFGRPMGHEKRRPYSTRREWKRRRKKR